MGGEWGVGASLAMEKAPRHLRGVMSGFLQQGYATGNLLAALCYLFVFPHWGWRADVLHRRGAGAARDLCPLGVKESEVWERTKTESWSHLGRAIFANWKVFLYIFVMIIAMTGVSHGTQDMYPTFLKTYKGFTSQQASYIGMVYNVGASRRHPHRIYSDRAGRRRAMVTALLLALIAIPLWAYAPNTVLLLIGAFALQAMVQGAWGVVPAHINELVPDNVRGFLPGFAYQCGVAAGGWITVIQDVMKEPHRVLDDDGRECGVRVHRRGDRGVARARETRDGVRSGRRSRAFHHVEARWARRISLKIKTRAARSSPEVPGARRVLRGEKLFETYRRIIPSTSSRFCFHHSGVVASRFRRSSGSVFEPRTLKCQSGNSAENPSSV
jgi:hypothetical protein